MFVVVFSKFWTDSCVCFDKLVMKINVENATGTRNMSKTGFSEWHGYCYRAKWNRTASGVSKRGNVYICVFPSFRHLSFWPENDTKVIYESCSYIEARRFVGFVATCWRCWSKFVSAYAKDEWNVVRRDPACTRVRPVEGHCEGHCPVFGSSLFTSPASYWVKAMKVSSRFLQGFGGEVKSSGVFFCFEISLFSIWYQWCIKLAVTMEF